MNLAAYRLPFSMVSALAWGCMIQVAVRSSATV
ncbi:Uncharacterised protein [Mycobacteroides abscessus subsp. abscessus]|nr:Uncharacterised protein [Mycobacteroides abscessus subsp. abscessus]